MRSGIRTLTGIVGLTLVSAVAAWGQVPGATSDSTGPWHDDAWTPIVEKNGVQVDYIYYPDADNTHDGIVVRLTNTNDAPVGYAFTLIFRTPEADTSTQVRGRLAPGEMRTGDDSGLFWVPFKGRDRSLSEIGLRGLETWPVRESGASRSGRT